MSPQVELATLVDLAISGPDSGAVNFSHLRTLLFGILKLTSHESSLVDTEQILIPQNLLQDPTLVSDANNNTSITKDNDSNKSGDKSVNVYPSEGNHVDKIESLENRLSSLEKMLSSFESFPDNKDVLLKNKASSSTSYENKLTADEQSPNTFNDQSDRLSTAWQNLKAIKRLEGAEEAIDKLFSLMNDILSQKNDSQINVKTNTHEDSLNRFTDFVEKLKSDFEQLKDTVETNKEGIENSNKSIETLDDSTKKNEQGVKECKSDIDNLKKIVSDINSEERKSSKEEKVEEKVVKEQEESADKITSNISSDTNPLPPYSYYDNAIESMQKQLNELKSTVESKADKSAINKSDDGLSTLVKSLEDKLNSLTDAVQNLKADLDDKAGKSSFDTLQKKVDKNEGDIKDLSQKVSKLDQSLSNMDNSDLKDIMANIEKLQKMSAEIDELRKLSDLKDLADNVQDLNKLKEAFDNLQNLVKENTNHCDDLENGFSSLLQNLENMKQRGSSLGSSLENELSNLKNLFDSQTDINTALRDYVKLDDLKKLNSAEPIVKQEEKQVEEIDSSINNGVVDQDSLTDVMQFIKELQDRLGQLQSNVNSLTANQNKLQQSLSDRPVIPPPAFDTSVLAAIQHLAQQNRQQIATLQADLNILRKVQKPNMAVSDQNKNEPAVVDNELIENLRNHLDTLQEEQVRLSGHMSNMLDDMKDEFNRKQNHIDALYDYVDKLQHNKADKDDINSEMDVKADKQALDGKVNMSTFDERYQLLEQALQDALNRLDQYVNQEENLKDALDKLNVDLDSKMDSDAEKKLKKFLESRLKDIQSSRTNLPENSHTHFDLRNAAGLRKPMLAYHCISCDRPIDVTMSGVQPPVPQNFPSKKSIAPHTSFELDQMRQSRKTPQPNYDKMTVSRQCGGLHTSVNSTIYRIQKQAGVQSNDGHEISEEISSDKNAIIDAVLGKDGHIYRGRFKPSERPPPLPKKVPYQNSRNKFQSRHKFAHSATSINQKSFLAEDERAHSVTNLGNGNTILLPPIVRPDSDGRRDSLGSDDIMRSTHSTPLNQSV